jgi:TonB family protein
LARNALTIRSRRRRRTPWELFLLASILVNGLVLRGLGEFREVWPEREREPAGPITLTIVQPPSEEQELEIEEPEPDEVGQLVEIAPPPEEKRPEEAEYLAEYDNVVEEETRSEQFKVNPEILSPEFSDEEMAEMEDLLDVNAEQESTGATTGNNRFDPDRDGTLASLPSKWKVTNREGPDAPMLSSQTTSQLSGAPQNDLLREKRGEATQLNTKEYLYAGYMQRIRRLVNFYWQQNIDNLPSSVRLARPMYTTAVKSILNADGALEYIEVTTESGSPELDDAVVRAFRVAGPFPNPPEGLIEKDGRVYLPDMTFTVQLGVARARYEGIDPRAGVQFPGILKSPR